MKKLLAKKLCMSQVFQEDGKIIPVTLLLAEAEPELKPGDQVKVSGKSKGKGFQGVVKRWGFKGSHSKTHGTKHTERAPGSIGSSFPQKVFKGKRMAGRMGGETKTILNLVVVAIQGRELKIKGAIPGSRGTKIVIEKYES